MIKDKNNIIEIYDKNEKVIASVIKLREKLYKVTPVGNLSQIKNYYTENIYSEDNYLNSIIQICKKDKTREFGNEVILLEPLNNNKWRIMNDFSYSCKINTTDYKIKVPKNYITNFASTPRLIWSLFPPWDNYGKATIIHDYLYDDKKLCDRKTADLIFLKCMEELNVSYIRRKMIYYAVRLFGWTNY